MSPLAHSGWNLSAWIPMVPTRTNFCETREHSWIHCLRTLQPLGLNAIDEKKYKQRRKRQVANPTASMSIPSGAEGGHSSQ